MDSPLSMPISSHDTIRPWIQQVFVQDFFRSYFKAIAEKNCFSLEMVHTSLHTFCMGMELEKSLQLIKIADFFANVLQNNASFVSKTEMIKKTLSPKYSALKIHHNFYECVWKMGELVLTSKLMEQKLLRDAFVKFPDSDVKKIINPCLGKDPDFARTEKVFQQFYMAFNLRVLDPNHENYQAEIKTIKQFLPHTTLPNAISNSTYEAIDLYCEKLKPPKEVLRWLYCNLNQIEVLPNLVSFDAQLQAVIDKDFEYLEIAYMIIVLNKVSQQSDSRATIYLNHLSTSLPHHSRDKVLSTVAKGTSSYFLAKAAYDKLIDKNDKKQCLYTLNYNFKEFSQLETLLNEFDPTKESNDFIYNAINCRNLFDALVSSSTYPEQITDLFERKIYLQSSYLFSAAAHLVKKEQTKHAIDLLNKYKGIHLTPSIIQDFLNENSQALAKFIAFYLDAGEVDMAKSILELDTVNSKQIRKNFALKFATIYAKKGHFEQAYLTMEWAKEAMKPLIKLNIERFRKP